VLYSVTVLNPESCHEVIGKSALEILGQATALRLEAERYHKTEVPVFSRKWFRFNTGLVPFQTGSTSVWKQEYFRFKQVVLPCVNRSTTVLNGSTLDRDKNGTECQNQLEWVKFFLFWPIPEVKCLMF